MTGAGALVTTSSLWPVRLLALQFIDLFIPTVWIAKPSYRFLILAELELESTTVQPRSASLWNSLASAT